MTHGFMRIIGIALAVLMVGIGPAWAGAYKHKRVSGDTPGAVPPSGGALNTSSVAPAKIAANSSATAPQRRTGPRSRLSAPISSRAHWGAARG